MVTIINKSNRPIGVANQSVLPDKEIQIKDKFVYCDVFDENGVATGKKQLLPGLKALLNMKFIEVKEEPEEIKPVKAASEAEVEEKPKAKRTRKTTTTTE